MASGKLCFAFYFFRFQYDHITQWKVLGWAVQGVCMQASTVSQRCSMQHGCRSYSMCSGQVSCRMNAAFN